jgi:hypothetical protein
MLHLKVLEKDEQAKPKTNRRWNNKNKDQNLWNRDKKKPYKESMKKKAGSLEK